MVKGGSSVEVYDKYGKKVIWEVVDDHVVKEGVEHEELGLRGFYFNLFHEERKGCVEYDVKYLPCLLMLMKLWPVDLENQLDRINKKVDDYNGIGGTQDNGIFRKLWRFSRN